MLDISSPEQFLQNVLTRFYEDLRAQEKNNYDWGRFSADGVDRSEESYTELHIETIKALARETEAFFRAWQLLADATSKSLFIDLLRYRLAGHRHVRLPVNTHGYWQERKRVAAIPHTPSSLTLAGEIGGPLRHYEFTFEDAFLKIDTHGLFWPFFIRQYFFERDGVRIRPEKGDHVIDAGACLGDTALAFAGAAGKEGAVYLFELIDAHLRVCKHNLAQNSGLSTCKIFPCGLSNIDFTPQEKRVSPEKYNPGFGLEPDNDAFPTATLDGFVTRGEIPRVDFIKMDIEGSELRALHGAKTTLQRFRPRLAISIYHDIEHFYAVPLFLDSLNLDYRFHLGHYSIHAGETVLYAASV